MKKLEEAVRSIKVTGLFWGPSKIVTVGYGIKLLGIECMAIGNLVRPVGYDDEDDYFDLFGEERGGSLKASTKKIQFGKSGLLLRKVYGEDINKAKESVRSFKKEGVVLGTARIVNAGNGFKYLRTVFTIQLENDDHVCLNTFFRRYYSTIALK
ncbi:unnamed protein product [Arabis nemorensis]|uniref:Translation elongation factor EF1B beta/delta subunit guanine nucleotide exchange domain-containing protein n=1 Tax=Arabis nemorensis TaxID=586526 RepID=A0A565BNE3_9BRAS|nr:unnamed protein product [Arabis nemorensis]